ncbi:hypothetical protein ABZ348_31185 [Streptomyces sp. NPDC005963]|uniref:hypothetical protein n=1 Tax=Streptomyces sp. NPDC005963 TaxID=3156721 RepID=UPI0033C98068
MTITQDIARPAAPEADDTWRALAMATIEELALKRAEFSADDVWLAGLPRPKDSRALGGILASAKRAGVIEDTGRIVPSVFQSGHYGPRRVWRSLVTAGA